MAKKIYDGLDYRQYQRRNSKIFFSLSKREQKELRQKGYWNVGWKKVRQSWLILREYLTSALIETLDYVLEEAKKDCQLLEQLDDLMLLLEVKSPLAALIKIKHSLVLMSKMLSPFAGTVTIRTPGVITPQESGQETQPAGVPDRGRGQVHSRLVKAKGVSGPIQGYEGCPTCPGGQKEN